MIMQLLFLHEQESRVYHKAFKGIPFLDVRGKRFLARIIHKPIFSCQTIESGDEFPRAGLMDIHLKVL